jgi:hypothetical protein
VQTFIRVQKSDFKNSLNLHKELCNNSTIVAESDHCFLYGHLPTKLGFFTTKLNENHIPFSIISQSNLVNERDLNKTTEMG